MVQETRLYDPDRDETRSMRSKEDAMDYRYFPDPDLLPLEVTAADLERARATLPELPQAMRERFVEKLGLTAYDAATLTGSRELAAYFEAALAAFGGEPKLLANWVMGDLQGRLNEAGLGADAARSSPPCWRGSQAHCRRHHLRQDRQGRVRRHVGGRRRCGRHHRGEGPHPDQRLGRHREDRRRGAGRQSEVGGGNSVPAREAFNALVGQAMKASRGKANPAQVNEILRRKLGA